MRLVLDETELAICRLSGSTARPKWARGSFVSITRVAEELTIICPASKVPARTLERPSVGRGWYRLTTPYEIEMHGSGTIVDFVLPLVGPCLQLMVISAMSVEHILVRDVDAAVSALEAEGITVVRQPVTRPPSPASARGSSG